MKTENLNMPTGNVKQSTDKFDNCTVETAPDEPKKDIPTRDYVNKDIPTRDDFVDYENNKGGMIKKPILSPEMPEFETGVPIGFSINGACFIGKPGVMSPYCHMTNLFSGVYMCDVIELLVIGDKDDPSKGLKVAPAPPVLGGYHNNPGKPHQSMYLTDSVPVIFYALAADALKMYQQVTSVIDLRV